jgi:predicted transcriptional regulator
MSSDQVDQTKDVLKGTTLEVYRFLLKSNKPVGTRELQRALNLSSSSVATYHLSKLEDAGLLKRESRWRKSGGDDGNRHHRSVAFTIP